MARPRMDILGRRGHHSWLLRAIHDVSGSIACENTALRDPYIGGRNICQCRGESAPFCDSHIAADLQCMDDNPSTQCWTQKHLIFVVTVMLILVPYFFCTLWLQATAQVGSINAFSFPWFYLSLLVCARVRDLHACAEATICHHHRRRVEHDRGAV